MWIGIISLFPENVPRNYRLRGNWSGSKNGLLSILKAGVPVTSHDRHRRTVDDRPMAAGPGMPNDGATLTGYHSCSKAAAGEGAKVIYLSPQGRKA